MDKTPEGATAGKMVLGVMALMLASSIATFLLLGHGWVLLAGALAYLATFAAGCSFAVWVYLQASEESAKRIQRYAESRIRENARQQLLNEEMQRRGMMN